MEQIRQLLQSRTRYRVQLTLMFIFPVLLLLLPVDFFDRGQVVCLSRLLANMECPGCGLTRASMRLIHLQFAEAYLYNPLVFIVLPILAGLYLQEMRRAWLWLRKLAED